MKEVPWLVTKMYAGLYLECTVHGDHDNDVLWEYEVLCAIGMQIAFLDNRFFEIYIVFGIQLLQQTVLSDHCISNA